MRSAGNKLSLFLFMATTTEYIVALERHRLRQRLFPLIARLESGTLSDARVAATLAEMYRVLL